MELNPALKEDLITQSLYLSYCLRCEGSIGHQAVVQYHEDDDPNRPYYWVEAFADHQEIGRQTVINDQRAVFIDTSSDAALSASITQAVIALEHPPVMVADVLQRWSAEWTDIGA